MKILILEMILIVGLIISTVKVLNLNHHPAQGIAKDVKGDTVNTDFDLGTLSSPYAFLMRREDGKVLLDLKGEEKIYPASMTKIMTVMLAAEQIGNPAAEVTLPNDFQRLYESNASMAGFVPGERVTAEDLFYGALLPSGADACLGLACEVSGSEEKFTGLMNKKAKELGLKDTHFTNADGLFDPDHYSTAKEIALLLDEALDQPEFYKVFTAKSHITAPNTSHPDGIWMSSTLFDQMETSTFPGGEVLGGKTGYTDEAGLCLASLAVIDGQEYILVTAKAPGTHQTEPFHIMDALSIYTDFMRPVRQ